MKKMLGFLLALTLVFSVFVGFGVAAEATPFEMNFEDLETEDIKKGDVWDLSETGRTFNDHAALYVYPGEGDSFAHGGTKSLQAGSDSARSGISVTYTTTALVPGTTYNVSAWSWCTAKTNGATLKIVAKDAGGAELAAVSLNDKTLNEWRNLLGTITIPEGAASYEFWFSCGGSQVTTYYDDIVLTPLVTDKEELLSAADANCESGDNWADVGDERYKDTNHRSTLGLDTIDDEKSVVKVTAKKSGNMVAFDMQNASLQVGVPYRFKFDYKTDNLEKPNPEVFLRHIYTTAETDTRILMMQFDISKTTYIDTDASGTEVTLCTDTTSTIPQVVVTDGATSTAWVTFNLCFTLPELEGYTYQSSALWIGMIGKAASKSMYFDNLSLKKDGDSVTFIDADGNALTEAPAAGSTVKARVSLLPGNGDAFVLAGKYANGAAKQLTGLQVATVERGEALTLTDGALADEAIKELYEGKLKCASVQEFPFVVAEGETVRAFLWEGANTLKPLLKNPAASLPAQQ